MKLKLILLIMNAIAATTRAQERPDEVQQAVTNDDGGKAFIVKMFQLSSVVKFGQPIAGDIEQHSIFLGGGDRKSTRLNSSHRTISYAVFCLKKKKKIKT